MSYFIIQEFVPPEIYSIYGVASSWFVDRRIIDICEKLRKDLGRPIYINNWHWGGSQKNSGYRLPDTTVGGNLSQHKFGRAVDLKIKGMTAEQGRQFLRDTWERYGITTIEKDTPTWIHIDIRYTGLDYLLEVPYR